MLADPQIAARGMIVEQQHPRLGTVRLPNLPFQFSDYSMPARTAVPELGQHNSAIATEHDLSEAEIEEMRAMGTHYSV